jgi:hypothetical protein
MKISVRSWVTGLLGAETQRVPDWWATPVEPSVRQSSYDKWRTQETWLSKTGREMDLQTRKNTLQHNQNARLTPLLEEDDKPRGTSPFAKELRILKDWTFGGNNLLGSPIPVHVLKESTPEMQPLTWTPTTGDVLSRRT